ncbi:tudor and KH domain-containing protein-like [Acanthaster planci]|uniref:Tudor and KH domain-containing protein-like n=1 Tax=Acanthaster planci TaxID=133434 RepID=A0A8B7Y088_ACAPL|nr:tudor and KH domain-containing protein-like [Acanthaster planci]
MKDSLTTRQWVALGITIPASIFLLYLLFKKRDEEEDYRPSKDLATGQQLTIELRVPYDKVGAIIGQQGVTIKKIQDETSCRVKFQSETGLEEKEDRLLVIRGKPDNALQAEQRVRKILAEPNAVQTLELKIPQWAIGRIIGRNGDNIRQICRTSKARVRIERDDDRRDPHALRECIIKGTHEQIRYAKGLIDEEIAQEEEYRRKLENASANRKQRGSKTSRDVMPRDQRQAVDTATADNHTKDDSDAVEHIVQMPTHDDYFSVYVSAVEHMGHFWLQVLGPKAGTLDLMIQNMTEYYAVESNQKLSKPDTLCTGDIVAAPFQGDESWYRARILEFLEDGQVDLYYVDFGDSDKMPRDSICSLRSDFLSLPYQAVECSLAGIQPDGSCWSEEAIDLFEDLTYCAKWKPLMARIVSYQQTSTGTLPCIELVDTTGTEDVNIASTLVERGYARFSNFSSSDASNQGPNIANGSSRLPGETLTVPPDSGESEGEEGEFTKEVSVTG